MDSAASDRPKSWDEEACPWHKGYPDEHGCTCSPEVIARREARSAAKWCEKHGRSYTEERCPSCVSYEQGGYGKITRWTCSCGRRNGPTVFCSACLKDRPS